MRRPASNPNVSTAIRFASRTAVLGAIKRRRATGQPLAMSHAPGDLVHAGTKHFGSWSAAVEAAGIPYADVRCKVARYTDEELLRWMRELASERPEMTRTELAKQRPFAALCARFGGWRAAAVRAGLVGWPLTEKRRWTKRAIVAELRRLAREGKPVSSDENLYSSAKRHFGSLAAAADAAGIDVRRPRKRSDEEILRTLRAIAREHGHVTIALARQAGIASAAHARFGGITAACEAAGVLGHEEKLDRKHAEEADRRAMLHRLREIAATLDRPVARRDLSWSLSEALRRLFGSLGAARKAAGLPDPPVPRRWTRKTVLAELRSEHARGTRLTQEGLMAAGRGDLRSAIPVYAGTLRKARRLARVPEPTPPVRTHLPFQRVWDEALVIEVIQELADGGEDLAYSRAPKSLVSAGTRYLGSWCAAIEAAGLDYDAIRLHRDLDDEKVLQMLRRIARARPIMTIGEARELGLTTIVYRRFGSFEAAAERAGISGWPVRRAFRPMAPDRVRAALLARVRGSLPINRAAVETDEPRLAYSVSRAHPVWAEALVAYGISSADGARNPSVNRVRGRRD